MIALCLQHAGIADGGGYTAAQLRSLKHDPWVSKNPGTVPVGSFTWKRQNLVFWSGTGLFLRTPVLLRMGMDVVWTEEDENGNALLNIDLRNADGEQVLYMRNNEWRVSTFSDLECGVRAKNLYVRHGNTRLKLAWHYLARDALVAKLKREWQSNLDLEIIEDLDSLVQDGMLTLLHLSARIEWPRHLAIGRDKIVFSGVTITRPYINNSQVALSIL